MVTSKVFRVVHCFVVARGLLGYSESCKVVTIISNCMIKDTVTLLSNNLFIQV